MSENSESSISRIDARIPLAVRDAIDRAAALQGRTRTDFLDETTRKELATKGDIQDVRKEIQDVRLEIEKVRAETRTAEMRLLKWQWGIALALAAIMAKGFGWIGF